ncbi:peptidase C39 bacteriocin processing; TPR repeat-containing protein [Thioalkalivibrio nitratireducens DSM 14787]|uniref:Peptidase C39 bacteriocin processing TPR repeat-containing protein n=1 Tax=Thioalkalivibrio nitratireducens (strain DSM 14787 / UNIQEM 213 / ALEN2) TaxID=1255043 RepID=L0E420_THIND|nr:PA2778 family cysteine peptidase [Thioalkalivibrio nitratireducens]AGA35401.1 peptidase C39 bacteriocin processing; TPR repeat-containing protein [Thioalkalivibrio nitratireducens DSM 14787]
MPVWLLLAALAAGCASAPQSTRIQHDVPADLPPRVELTATPFFPQQEYQCGPAALATVLTAEDIEVLPDDLVAEVYVPERRGSLQAEMRAAARARGLVAYRLRPELDDLLAEIAAGRPVVVFQNLGLGFAPRWHYAVVIGYDLEAGQIVLRSGTIERHVNALPRFERTWARGDHWAFVAVPPDRLPASAEPLRWLSAVNELEQTGMLEPARTGYETAIRHWPGQPIGYIGLANTQFAAGDFPGAEDALHALLETQPGRHEVWNNLAHVLVARQCGPLARQAAACASRLAPQSETYQRTVRTAAGAAASGTACRPLPSCPAETEAAPGDVRP